jgi:uncharacterized protein
LSVSSAERIDVMRVAPRAWKNGAGLTRELAASPADATLGDFDWRISIADIARDAPFSAFPGVDRCIVLLDGGGMWLRSASGRTRHRLERPFEPFRFAGDEAIDATLLEGPSTDFNVMTRAGRWLADVQPGADRGTIAPADAAFVLCWRGRAMVQTDASDDIALEAGQALIWRHTTPLIQLRCDKADSRVLMVRMKAITQEGAA